MAAPLLEIRRLGKAFTGLRALDDVSFDVGQGEIVALVGQNGSGKSTLVKILSGLHQPDPGSEVRVHLEGGAVGIDHADARAALHFIHQDLGLIPQLSTVENLDLVHAPGRGVWRPLSLRHEERRAAELIAEFAGDFDVRAPVQSLSAAERTIVAIVRALSGWTHARNVLVLDEPTAALEGAEIDQLFRAIRRVAERGAGVVFISHHLQEVLDLADRVIVLRDGCLVTDVPRAALDPDQLIRLITGRELADLDVRAEVSSAPELLTVRGLSGGRVRGVDLAVGAGEVLGVTGLLGSGRDELAGMVFGAQPRTAGEVRVAGERVPTADPRTSIAHGIAYVPADRRRHGAVMTMSARENLTLGRLQTFRGPMGSLARGREREEVLRWTAAVELQPSDPERPLTQFSGGNQQKVVLAKWLRMAPRVLLLDEPTQGVDIGAKAAIYDLVSRAAAEGSAVLVSSSDTKELALLCHRVLVLHGGRVTAQVEGSAISEERLVQETLGASQTIPNHADGVHA